MVFESKNFGMFSILLCSLGIILFITIELVTENAGEILGDKSVLALLFFVEGLGVVLGILSRDSIQGKIGLALAVSGCIIFIFLAPTINFSSNPSAPSEETPLDIRIRKPRKVKN